MTVRFVLAAGFTAAAALGGLALLREGAGAADALRSARGRVQQDEGGQTGQVHVLDDAGKPGAVPLRIGIADGSVTEGVAGALASGARVIIGAARGAPAQRQQGAGLVPRFGF
ncbi:hypothetical protein [Elioraea sp.]|uniref:hypothetical protein n=1 Tax=Elioraea sp. TaxID=2185103 RepID=UPI0025C31754|nr:hypothetical protein [Elioraea sp.]